MTNKVDIGAVGSQILTETGKIGGQTWPKIQKASGLYVRGYVQSLTDIAGAVAAGDMTKDEGKVYAENAKFLLAMSVANASEITLFQVQSLLNKVLDILKGQINKVLPIAVL